MRSIVRSQSQGERPTASRFAKIRKGIRSRCGSFAQSARKRSRRRPPIWFAAKRTLRQTPGYPGSILRLWEATIPTRAERTNTRLRWANKRRGMRFTMN